MLMYSFGFGLFVASLLDKILILVSAFFFRVESAVLLDAKQRTSFMLTFSLVNIIS
jgi:hypothetical protein